MHVFKYQALASDICNFLDFKGWSTFDAFNVAMHINEERGFYRYSKGTLYRAFRHLINSGEIELAYTSKSGYKVYTYNPNIDACMRGVIGTYAKSSR